MDLWRWLSRRTGKPSRYRTSHPSSSGFRSSWWPLAVRCSCSRRQCSHWERLLSGGNICSSAGERPNPNWCSCRTLQAESWCLCRKRFRHFRPAKPSAIRRCSRNLSCFRVLFHWTSVAAQREWTGWWTLRYRRWFHFCCYGKKLKWKLKGRFTDFPLTFQFYNWPSASGSLFCNYRSA